MKAANRLLATAKGGATSSAVFRQSKTQKFDGSASAYNVALTSGVTAGDTLIVILAINDSSAGITGISGCGATWTKLDDQTDAGQMLQASRFQFWKGVGATSGSTVTITLTNLWDGGAIIGVFGSAATQIAHPAGRSSGGVSTTAVQTPSATTTSGGQAVVGGFVFESSALRSVSSHTDAPEAWTTIAESNVDPALTWLFGLSYVIASGAETTTRTTTMSGTGTYWAFAVVLG